MKFLAIQLHPWCMCMDQHLHQPMYVSVMSLCLLSNQVLLLFFLYITEEESYSP